MIFRSLKAKLDAGYNRLNLWRHIESSRSQARRITKELLDSGYRKVPKEYSSTKIEEYALRAFGHKGYATWLELYALIHGQFESGWIPDDFYRTNLINALNPPQYRCISMLKSFDSAVFGLNCVIPLFCSRDGRLIGGGRLLSLADCEEILSRHEGEIVVKVDAGASATSTKFVSARSLDLKEIVASKKNLVFQAPFEQHEAYARLNPSSVNTIRILTFLDEQGPPRVLYTKGRFGAEGSRVDNTRVGGRAFFFDDESRVSDFCHDSVGRKFSFPVKCTEAFPGVSLARDCAIRLHVLVPFLRIVAWDFVVDREGTARLLEWNTRSPDVWVNEALVGPLWPSWCAQAPQALGKR